MLNLPSHSENEMKWRNE